MVYENKKDWPEKYNINQLVSNQENIDQLVRGNKVSVRRNDRYADVGDEVILDGHLFIVEDVYPQYLRNMTEEQAHDEGYKSLEDYKEALTSIHKSVVWDPDQLVWAHYLKEK